MQLQPAQQEDPLKLDSIPLTGSIELVSGSNFSKAGTSVKKEFAFELRYSALYCLN